MMFFYEKLIKFPVFENIEKKHYIVSDLEKMDSPQ